MHHDTDHDSTHYDAIIVGARAAGAATAMLLARRGLRVLCFDRAQYGSDTLSTHALMRTAVTLLERWGLLPTVAAADTPLVQTTTFYYDDDATEVHIEPRGDVPGLYAPRRHVLDAILVDAAVAAGAEVRHGVTFSDVTRDADGRVDGVVVRDAGGVRRLSASLVIGADGVRSAVARSVGARTYRAGLHASATIYGYFEDYTDDGYNWYYGTDSGAGAIATTAGQTCIFAATSQDRFMAELRGDLWGGFEQLLSEMTPSLADKVGRATPVDALRGFAGIPGHMRTASGPGWALVGDAGYFRDPFTAQGISDAFRDAELLVRAVATGGQAAMRQYQAARDALCLPTFMISDELASFRSDLPTVQRLHRDLSAEMARQVRALQQLDAPGSTGIDGVGRVDASAAWRWAQRVTPAMGG